MPIVPASFRYHLHLGATGTREVGAGVVRLHPKLFQALHGGRDHGPRRGHEPVIIPAATFHVARGVATVEHKSVLIHPRSRDGSAV